MFIVALGDNSSFRVCSPIFWPVLRRRGWMGGWLCRTSVAMQSEAHSYFIHGVLPPSMISVVLVPIVKNKRISICSKNNYRPIALASIMSKLLEKIIYERVSET